MEGGARARMTLGRIRPNVEQVRRADGLNNQRRPGQSHWAPLDLKVLPGPEPCPLSAWFNKARLGVTIGGMTCHGDLPQWQVTRTHGTLAPADSCARNTE